MEACKDKLRTKYYDVLDAFRMKIDLIISDTDKNDITIVSRLISEKVHRVDSGA